MASTDSNPTRPIPAITALILAAVLVIGILLIVAMGAIWGFKAFNRSQAVADANNKVKTTQIAANNQVELNRIQIGAQQQRVKIAKQQAQIRLENAKGLRQAQDEISRTLTPLYVQFEMVDALKEIAKSGKNSSVVYVPSGANGIPLVSGVAGQPSVTVPGAR